MRSVNILKKKIFFISIFFESKNFFHFSKYIIEIKEWFICREKSVEITSPLLLMNLTQQVLNNSTKIKEKNSAVFVELIVSKFTI